MNVSSSSQSDSKFWPRYRFTLGTLLLILTLTSVWGARRTNLAREQRLATRAIVRAGGFVNFDWQPDFEEEARRQVLVDQARMAGQPVPEFVDGPSGPAWLRRWVGVEYFQRVVRVGIRGGGDRTLSESELTAICGLPHLTSLRLYDVKLVDAVVLELSNHPRLRHLTLTGCELTDNHCSMLSRLRTLAQLTIDSDAVTDHGLAHLAALDLQELTLIHASISDDSVPILATRFPQLNRLRLQETEISMSGYSKLKRGAPNMELHFAPSTAARRALPKHLQQLVIPTGAPIPIVDNR